VKSGKNPGKEGEEVGVAGAKKKRNEGASMVELKKIAERGDRKNWMGLYKE